MSLQHNAFSGPANLVAQGDFSASMIFGYVQTSSLSFGGSNKVVLNVAGDLVPAVVDDLDMLSNTFTRLIFPVYLDARVGRLRFTANQIQQSLRGLTITSLLGFASATNRGVEFANKTLQGAFQTILSDPLSQNALTVAAAFPTPASFQPSDAIALAAAPAKATAPSTAPESTLVAVAPSASAVPFLAKKDISPFASQITRLLVANAGLLPFVLPPPPDLSMRLDISGNDMQMFPGSVSFAVLIDAGIYNTLYGMLNQGLLTMTGNRITSQSPAAAVILSDIARCAITGNVVLNTQAARSSSVMIGMAKNGRAAITGNVFQGRAALPARSPVTSPPEDPWDRYNTEF
jgi:hypothetical protein